MIALKILFNILLFTAAMFFTTLIIEKFYSCRFRWIMFLTLAAIMAAVAIMPYSVLSVLNALFHDFSMKHLATILLGGIFSGVFISFF